MGRSGDGLLLSKGQPKRRAADISKEILNARRQKNSIFKVLKEITASLKFYVQGNNY